MSANGIPGGGVPLGAARQVPVARMTTLTAGVLDVQAGPAPGTDSPAYALLIDVPAGTVYALPLDLPGVRKLRRGLGELIVNLEGTQSETPAAGGREDTQP